MATGKNLVVLAFTRYDPVKKKWLGDASLGGGGMALRGKLNAQPRQFSDNQVPYFDTSRAAHLASHPWFQPD